MLKLLRKMPEFAETELHGCDVSPDALEAVRRTSPRVWVTPCDPFPPSRYASSCFGRVLAFSVFSHLAESAHLAWAAEFARIVHPGGHAVITVQGDKYLDLCEDYRSGAKPITHPWHQDLANSFAEPDARARFDAGEFLFKERRLHPDGAAPTYGEAVVPRSYIEARWGDAGFDLIDWNDRWGQNWCVLRRR
jgi:hypothetical protein